MPKYERLNGYYSHPVYKVWHNMKDRCYNLNYHSYKNYGGRGIIVCDKWINSSKTFIEWALPLWKKGLQIDREDNDGNYTPENCRFVTSEVNTLNQRLLTIKNTSGYRGVYFDKTHNKWAASISINKHNRRIGYFNTPIEAAMAYDKAVPDSRPRNFK